LGELCGQKLSAKPDCWKDPEARLRIFSVDAFGE
jgi:hypothetical protein